MHEMQTIVMSVCKFVGLSVTRLCGANTDERIDVLLWVETLGDPKNIVL